MSYSFTTKPNTAVTVSIPVKADTTGATLTVEFSESSTFRSISLIKPATGSFKVVTLSLTAADVQLLTDSHYRVKSVKAGKTTYIQDGTVDYVEPATSNTGGGTVDLAELDGRYVNTGEAVPLAVAGNGQDPLGPGSPTVGTQGAAARSDHVHPLPLLNPLTLGAKNPRLAKDIIFDGTTSFTAEPFGLQRNGTVYSPSNDGTQQWPWGNRQRYGFSGRNITLNQGVSLILNPNGATSPRPYGWLFVATETITINGTLDVSGLNAVGAVGGGPALNWGSSWAGGQGASGTTGAGSKGLLPFAQTESWGWGGGGGAGGNASAGAILGGAGALTYQSYMPGGLPVEEDEVLYLKKFQLNANGNNLGGGGAGGSSGAGDGTNAGGGGGQGGNVLILIAPRIIIGASAIIRANGGKGANGTGGNAGGGGGGGGGVVSMQASSLSIATGATMTAQGGAGGAGSGTGLPGLPGPQSAVFTDPTPANGGYGFGAGFFLNQWQ